MAFYDRRTMDGVYSVRQSATYIMNYRYAEERMMRMMAGWIALTPELQVKLEMARQVYEDALHADAFGKRLGELRSQAQLSKPPNELFVTFMNMIEDKEEWEDTIERLVGIYRVLKPHLISHYSAHIEAANPVYEPPTLRILARLVEEEKRHVERGSVLLGDLLDSAEKHRRASQWEAHLDESLAASGGVTGFADKNKDEQPGRLGRS
jgi:1,2-phenylacetyl-CoA epoxidase catalytic subunit